MEKDIDKIAKNPDTDIVIRIDDFGGRRGLTIREFVKSERYTGFTKAGTRIPVDKFKQFKEAINSIDENDMVEVESPEENTGGEESASGESESGEKAEEESSEQASEEETGEQAAESESTEQIEEQAM